MADEQAVQTTITALDFITRALGILGDIAEGESPTAYQASVGLEGLNAMLDSNSIQRSMIFQIRQESFTWPSATVSRTIGPSGDFNTHRPDMIANGTHFKDSNNITYICDVIRNREVYDKIEDKTTSSSYPEMIFYEPAHPLGTIFVYPIPAGSLTFNINTWQPLQVFDTLTEALALPPGYRRMIPYNLALELEAEIGLPVPPEARKIARESKRVVKNLNNLPIVSTTENYYVLRGGRRSDIVAGR